MSVFESKLNSSKEKMDKNQSIIESLTIQEMKLLEKLNEYQKKIQIVQEKLKKQNDIIAKRESRQRQLSGVVEKISKKQTISQELIQNNQFQLDGIFQGHENEIRITSDNMISVFDFIRVAGGQKDFYSTWNRILNCHKNEIQAFCQDHQFELGKKKTPVISVHGMVKLLFWLPGETAKQFRSKSAEIMIRYLGGDLTLVDEIKTIDNHHTETPNNIAKVFRDEANKNCAKTFLFNQDQINTSNKLIQHFGNQTDVFYLFSFVYELEWYAKFGIVGDVREFHRRIDQHKAEFGDICFNNVMKCLNVRKVESDFKDTSLFRTNKVKIPKKTGGNHTEIIKLSEIVTTDDIKNQMFRTAGDRVLDPPTYLEATNDVSTSLQTNNELSLHEIDLEKTKEIEKTKQMELNNQLEIKKLEIQLEMKKLDFEMMKFTR